VIVSPYDIAAVIDQATRAAEASTSAVAVVSQPDLGSHERPDIETPFVAPRDEIEERLTALWQTVLGIERIGIHDNFFSLGGDSILGIQVAARAREAGLNLTARTLHQHPTVAELAAMMQPTPTSPAPDGSAPIPLIPIQQWFFERDLLDSHHFNQSAVLETPAGTDPSLVQRALDALVEHHDALRLRYVTEQGQAVQILAPVADARAAFTTVDLSALTQEELDQAIVERATSLQASLDLGNGPLVSTIYFDCGPSRAGQLLLVIHHPWLTPCRGGS
jgi:aryl carrier-like protein